MLQSNWGNFKMRNIMDQENVYFVDQSKVASVKN